MQVFFTELLRILIYYKPEIQKSMACLYCGNTEVGLFTQWRIVGLDTRIGRLHRIGPGDSVENGWPGTLEVACLHGRE